MVLGKQQDEHNPRSYQSSNAFKRKLACTIVAARFTFLILSISSVLSLTFEVDDKPIVLFKKHSNQFSPNIRKGEAAASSSTRKLKSRKQGKKSFYTSKASKNSKSGAQKNAATAWPPKAKTTTTYQHWQQIVPTCKPFYQVAPLPITPMISPMPAISTNSRIPTTGSPAVTPSPITSITISPTVKVTHVCNMSVNERVNGILGILLPISGYENIVTNTSSPQFMASQWLIYSDEANLCPDQTEEIQQRYVFAVFYYSTSLLPWNNCGAQLTSPCTSIATAISRSNVDISKLLDGAFSSSFKDTTHMNSSSAATIIVTQRWLSPHNECSWYGVKCNDKLKAMYIWLDSNNLAGTIPFELSSVLSLTGISLLRNSLYGTLPSSLGDSNTNMVDVQVAFNNLSGTVPASYSKNWSLLKSFNVEGNSLQGSLFSSSYDAFGASFATLEELVLADNLFEGTISPGLGAFRNLTRISLEKNSFTGTMPPSICELPNLIVLEADCAGPVPEVTCSCCTKCYTDSGGDDTTLPTFAPFSPIMMPIFVPPSLSPMKENVTTYAPTIMSAPSTTTNKPTATTDNNSTSKCNMTTSERNNKILKELLPTSSEGERAFSWIVNVDEKYVCPSDPTLPQRYALAAFYFAMNGDAWSQCSHNVSLPCDKEVSSNSSNTPPSSRWLSSTSECYWYGISCSISMDNRTRLVSSLDLHNNNLANEIPSEIGILNTLKTFLLQSNKNINGTLPTTLGQLPMLEELDLDKNQIGGRLPLELFRLHSLQILALSDNKFSGPLPSEIGNLGNLSWVQLFGNADFSGTLPTQMGELFYMTVLTVQKTNFTGTMPSSVCALLQSRGGMLNTLQAECGTPPNPPLIKCDCCTGCFSSYSSVNSSRSNNNGLMKGLAFVSIDTIPDRAGMNLGDSMQLYHDVIRKNRSPREWQVID